jgi:ATP-dependent DNA helicase RecG
VPFFNQEWRARQTPAGTRVAVSGVLERFRSHLQLKNAQLVVLGTGDAVDEVDRIRPTYPATEALPTTRIARYVAAALDALPPVEDHLPEELRSRHELPRLDWALRRIHRPEDAGDVRAARDRLVYDELLSLQVGVQQRRQRLEADVVGIPQPPLEDGLAARFLAQLPFTLTADQAAALGELGGDLARGLPMHRLLQGDVGTGKTLVAAWAMLTAVDHGHQGVLMVPTEVLAEQHHRTLTRLLAPLGVNAPGGPRLELLTGSLSAGRLRGLLAELAGGDVPLLIGTHALLEERVRLADLGVVVIDEQHRFGVEHRTRLRDKRADGRTPDVLVMTATPIPRSLALTLYGDLDVTTLRQRPVPVRVRTVVLEAASPRRAKLHGFIRERVARGERAFVVCPTIQPSEALGVRAATDVHAELSERVFPDLAVGLVHGRLPADERDQVMEAFRRGDLEVLVATTVIEVGVDVPEATVMLVEDADRFGISQLHQLRGRLHRGRDDNWCVLFSSNPSENPRLEALERTDDGFALAEIDLELRGEGSLFDTRQSGLPDLKLARLVRDGAWVARSREDARALVTADPELDRHPRLRAEVRRRYGDERLAALSTG